MKIKNNIQIFTDNGENIHNKPCVLTFYYEREAHPLDGVYGVSGAERDRKDCYMKKVYETVLGVFDQDDHEITTIYGRKINVNDYIISGARLIDVDKIIKDYTK